MANELLDNFKQGLIKVAVGDREELWAYPIGHNYAQIANIPFVVLDLGLDDIVETEITSSKVRKFVQIIKKNSHSHAVNMEVDNRPGVPVEINTQASYETSKAFLYSHGFQCEGMQSNVLVVAVPVVYTEDYFRQVISQCPIMLTEKS